MFLSVVVAILSMGHLNIAKDSCKGESGNRDSCAAFSTPAIDADETSLVQTNYLLQDTDTKGTEGKEHKGKRRKKGTEEEKKGSESCTPGQKYASAKDACEACHKCRTFNACPCATFTVGDGKSFCYDPNAADAGTDAHATQYHCETLAPDQESELCPKNAAASTETKKSDAAEMKAKAYCVFTLFVLISQIHSGSF